MTQGRSKVVAAFGRKPLNFPPQSFGGNFRAALEMIRAQDRILRVFGRAALLRRPRIQGGAAALPYREGEEICPAPK